MSEPTVPGSNRKAVFVGFVILILLMLLIVSRQHIESVADLAGAGELLIGHMVMVANRLAGEAGVAEKGYRLVVNCGPEGGQEVPHLHMHLLGGRQMGALG